MRPLELATKPVQVQTSDVMKDPDEETLEAVGEENIRKISSAMVIKEIICFCLFLCLFESSALTTTPGVPNLWYLNSL
jgi:hypothetical protein